MKNRVWKIVGIIAIVALFIFVVVTSIVLSKKRSDLDNIPEVEMSERL